MVSIDKEWLLLSRIRGNVETMSEIMDATPIWNNDLDTDYGPNDIDACLGIAGLQLVRVLNLINARMDEIAIIKQEEWREIGAAEMDAAR
jgi:hypothetical protein